MTAITYTQVESGAAGHVEPVGVVIYGRVARDAGAPLAREGQLAALAAWSLSPSITPFRDADDWNCSRFGEPRKGQGDAL